MWLSRMVDFMLQEADIMAFVYWLCQGPRVHSSCCQLFALCASVNLFYEILIVNTT
jgi:hypothetical protein